MQEDSKQVIFWLSSLINGLSPPPSTVSLRVFSVQAQELLLTRSLTVTHIQSMFFFQKVPLKVTFTPQEHQIALQLSSGTLQLVFNLDLQVLQKKGIQFLSLNSRDVLLKVQAQTKHPVARQQKQFSKDRSDDFLIARQVFLDRLRNRKRMKRQRVKKCMSERCFELLMQVKEARSELNKVLSCKLPTQSTEGSNDCNSEGRGKGSQIKNIGFHRLSLRDLKLLQNSRLVFQEAQAEQW